MVVQEEQVTFPLSETPSFQMFCFLTVLIFLKNIVRFIKEKQTFVRAEMALPNANSSMLVKVLKESGDKLAYS